MKKNLKRGEKSRSKKNASAALEREPQKSASLKKCFRRNQVYARLRY
jgi:hypothetical protein